MAPPSRPVPEGDRNRIGNSCVNSVGRLVGRSAEMAIIDGLFGTAVARGTALLLTGDAVYALQPGTAPFSALKAHGLQLFVLAEDVKARSIEIPDRAKAIDYPAFVELSIHHDKVNSWL